MPPPPCSTARAQSYHRRGRSESHADAQRARTDRGTPGCGAQALLPLSEALAIGVGVYGLCSAGAWASPGHPRLPDTLLLGYAALGELQIDAAIARLATVLPRFVRRAPVPT